MKGYSYSMIEMAINGSGIRDTARVLHINKNTVIATFKKKEKGIIHINPTFKTSPSESALEVRLARVCEEAELDEQWSFVGKKSNQRWLSELVDITRMIGEHMNAILRLKSIR
jgi:hypothetical protein